MDELQESYGTIPVSQAQALWAELAAAARQPAQTPGAELGRALDSSHAEALAHVLAPLLEVIRMTEPAGARYREEVAALLLNVPRPTLTKALEKLDIPDRRRVLNTASRLLAPASLVPLVVCAAPSYEQTISARFGELLARLATEVRGDTLVAQRAEDSFRTLVQHLNDRWAASLLNTSSTGFDLLYRDDIPEISKSALAPGPSRIMQLSLETGAVGPMVWLALRSLAESEEGIRRVVELLKTAEPTLASKVITEQIATPGRLALLLREQPIDWGAADALVAQLGVNAARTLIDQLVIADTRATRRSIMDRLVQIGPEIRAAVLERITDERWYVVRNMVLLLREAGCFVEPVLGDSLATHADARVRREALLLRVERTGSRDRALSDALRDPDKQVVRTALHAAGSVLPGSGVLVLSRRLSEPTFPTELRPLALILVGRSSAPAALEALLRVVDGGRTLLGRTQLAPKSPDLIAALTGLARSWTGDARAREFLRLAARTNDPEIMAAIRTPATQEGA